MTPNPVWRSYAMMAASLLLSAALYLSVGGFAHTKIYKFGGSALFPNV